MSTIVISNIKATGETASRAVSGVAAAGANWNGVSFGVRDSTNVSSVTDNATADFTMNYTSSMSSAEYMFAGVRGRARASGSQDGMLVIYDSASSPTSSTTRIRSYNEAFSSEDFHRNCIMIFGDLA